MTFDFVQRNHQLLQLTSPCAFLSIRPTVSEHFRLRTWSSPNRESDWLQKYSGIDCKTLYLYEQTKINFKFFSEISPTCQIHRKNWTPNSPWKPEVKKPSKEMEKPFKFKFTIGASYCNFLGLCTLISSILLACYAPFNVTSLLKR